MVYSILTVCIACSKSVELVFMHQKLVYMSLLTFGIYYGTGNIGVATKGVFHIFPNFF